MTLSSDDIIENTIQRNISGFQVVDTMGSMIGNQKWGAGFNEFQLGKRTKDSYVWEALSAVSENVGQTLYSNVLHYIDNVSNVDTCKIKSLKSMLEMVNFNYLIIDKIQYYPIEIQALLDLLSINKKHLFNNEFMKESFINALSVDGIISNGLLTDISAEAAGNIGSSLSVYKYDKAACDQYFISTYYNFMHDMLNMDSAISTEEGYVKIYDLIALSDNYGNADYVQVDRYAEQKRSLNVPMSFNVEDEVDKINVGQTSIDDYSGDELNLVNQEIEYRKSLVSYNGKDAYVAMDLRNGYYKKKKVIEYARFIDNLTNNQNNLSSLSTYQYDPSYYVNADMNNSYVLKNVGSDEQPVEIDEEAVKKAAVYLMQMTNYINKIREMIRLQVRKIFMKGTNNLLQYSVNEFLVDYANQLTTLIPESEISSTIAYLSAHPIRKVSIQEYWDQTEYMNISTETSKDYALNYRLVNDRYFDETFTRQNDKLVPTENGIFTNSEINEFYLSTLNLKNDLAQPSALFNMADGAGLSSSFYEFLSVMFDVAADTSYYDDIHNVFGTRLSNGMITHDIFDDLQAIKDVSAYVMSCANKASYEFSTVDTIKQQKDELVQHLEDVLEDQYLSAVSAVYDEYSPDAQQISSDFDGDKLKLSTYLNTTYSHYFCQSNNSYSFDEYGTYRFPYFINNPSYLTDDYYIVVLNAASSWITENCTTYPLAYAIEQLSNGYDNTRSILYQNIVNQIEPSGFIDLGLDNMSEEMDSVKSFLNAKIDSRTKFLQDTLASLRTQANQLKTTYDSITTQFQSILAQMPDTTQGFKMVFVGKNNGRWQQIASSTPIKTASGDEYIYDQYSNTLYKDVDDGKGPFKKVALTSGVSESKTIVQNINAALDVLDSCKDIYYGTVKSGYSGAVNRSYGTQKEALNSLLANILKLKNQHDNILDQVKQVYQIDEAKIDSMKTSDVANVDADIYAVILKLVEYLGTSISEKEFSQDLVLSEYNSYMKSLTDISAEYVPMSNEYEVLWSVFSNFLNEFDKASDYKSFTPGNIDKLNSYRISKDARALNEIRTSFGELYSSYQSLVERFMKICDNRIQLYKSPTSTYVYEYTGDVLEECLNDFQQKLAIDIKMKQEIGNRNIQNDINELESNIDKVTNGIRMSGDRGLYIKYFYDSIPSFNTATDYEKWFDTQVSSFPSIFQSILDLLEYTKYSSYDDAKIMFQNYTGIAPAKISADQLVAYDPYYNHKNQTHPSYQIHPFLWNFVEKSIIDPSLDAVSKAFVNIDIENLEGAAVAEHIDEYIGKFGNLIDVWKTNIRDFTSYSTRYEQSNHVCRYTNISSEVVDYDGAFYPPALDAYLKRSPQLSSYYSHLNLDADENMNSKIMQLLEDDGIYQRIQDITQPADLSGVHDIFKYQVDAFGNMYILYKQYSSTDATYAEKLNTVGELWIRPADFPIAFPFLSFIDADSSYKQLSNIAIYDFEIAPTGKKIVVAAKKLPGQDNGTSYEQMFIRTIALYISYEMLNVCGVGKLSFTTYDPQLATNYQETWHPLNVYNEYTSTFRKYLGSYSRNNTTIDSVYIECGFNQPNGMESSIPDNPAAVICTTTVNAASTTDRTVNLAGIANVADTNPAVTWYKKTADDFNIDIAFVVNADPRFEKVRSWKDNVSVDIQNDSLGYLYDDPIHSEMNSFDVFENSIQIATINGYVLKGINGYQQNADMGYIPSYAGIISSKILDISEEVSQSHQAVELLGKSRNVDMIAERVNSDANPYLTKKEIYDNYLVGRVYENGPGELSNTYFNYDDDKSLKMLHNRAMYNNMPQTMNAVEDGIQQQFTYDKAYNSFVWNVYVGDAYKPSDLSDLKIFVYSTKTLGKNPYIVKSLSSIMSESEELSGDELLDAYYNSESEFVLVDESIGISGYAIKVVGTQNGVDEEDASYSNNIRNIASMKYKYSMQSKSLMFKFQLDDTSMPTHIDEDDIRIVIINAYDIKFFEWFHILDENASPEDIVESLNRLTTQPYTKEQMLAVDLSQYKALSDVQIDGHKIFDTYNKMQFKVDEEDIFPLSHFNYYVPSLNIKYPMTFAQVFDQNYEQQDIDQSSLVKIFNEDEVYVIEAQDANVLSTIEELAFTQSYISLPDEVLVYEDYNDYYDKDKDILNNQLYVLQDPLFYQFVQFTGTRCTSGEINVPTSAWQEVQTSLDDATDAFSQFLRSSRLSAMHGENAIDEYAEVDTIDMSTLDDEQKIALVNKARKFLRLYFGYKKGPDGLTLYVNYSNFINSPFVKIQDGQMICDTIEGTYAKIPPDESRDLNVILQFKQYQNGQLIGYKNVIVTTYQIYNISDDKPKFILKKLSGFANAPDASEQTVVRIAGEDCAKEYSSSMTSLEYSVKAESTGKIGAEISCSVFFPMHLISSIDGSTTATYKTIVLSDSTKTKTIKLGLKQDLGKYKGQTFPVQILDVQSDADAVITPVNGSITLT